MRIRSLLGWPFRASGRPLQRSVSLLIAWTFLCYALFQMSSGGGGGGNAGGGEAPNSIDYAGTGSVNSRLLLQKVTESPPTSTAFAPGVANTPTPRHGGTEAGAALKTDAQAKSAPSAEQQLAPLIQANVPNVPFEFWLREKNRIYGKNHTCAFYPSVFDIKYNNK